MTTGTFENGDYTEEDDSSGDYRILDPQGNVIFRWDESKGEWNLENNPLTNISSVSTDDATINNDLSLGSTNVDFGTKSVADDSVVTFDSSLNALIHVTADLKGGAGMFVTAFNEIPSALTGSRCANEGSTDLTGTTGSDNSLNVSRVDNSLHVENRLGQSAEVDVLQFTR